MKVLLTGVTGWIGSHVARELLRRGHEVHATRRPTSDLGRIRDFESRMRFYEGPMDSIPVEADVTIHLAWSVVPGKYATAPDNRDCLDSSLRLLRELKGRVVFAGTCFEHDTTLGRLHEGSPIKPTSLYAECKNALRVEVEKRPNSAWVRFFYQYGPWEDERRLIPSIIRSIQAGRPAKLSPGEQRRDYLHVEDVARAVCSVAESSLQGPVNVGSGEAPTLRDLALKIAEMGARPDLVQLGAVPYYQGEPMLIVADNALLKTTGWVPKYDLDEGLRQTFDWWRRA